MNSNNGWNVQQGMLRPETENIALTQSTFEVSHRDQGLVEPILSNSTLQIPNDTYFDKQWSFHNTGQPTEPYDNIGTPDADIDAPEAWNIQTGDGSIVIAVIDTGVDYHHPDLDDNIWTNPGEIADNGIDDDGNGFVDDYYGWDFFYGDSDPDAGLDRGTHLAGIIAAEGNNNMGVAGINWDAQIMPIRIYSNWGTASGLSAVHAVEYATMMGADIIQISGGLEGAQDFPNIYQQDLYDAIAAAEEAGILFIAPAGNNNKNIDTDFVYPASYDLDNIITVTSTDENDNRETSSGNYGATNVDLAAPGGTFYSRIYSTLPETFHGPVPEGEYGEIRGGTAIAVPHVSGVAALIWAEDPELTAAEVKQVLLESVDPLPDLEGITVSGGRLNAYNALVATQAGKIKGRQWHDQDQDGVWDAGEAALENWTIYIDANQNGQLDENEKFALTDKDGNYSLNLLQPGTHTIAQVSQPGWSQTYPLAQTHEIELAAEEIISGVDFANVLSNPAQIQGNKWHDLDGDGIKDQGENGLAGWTIYLDQNQNGQLDAGERSTVTDAEGNYTFTNLPPGTYTLGEITQAGWESTYANPTPVAFEYVWSDSNQPNGPSFNWIDISGVGTSLYFSDDDDQVLVDLPFDFPFYDKTKDFVNISSNGFLTFMVGYEETIVGSSSRALETPENSSTLSASKVYVGQQAPIPHVVPPNGVMAVFWEDLDPNNGDGVYYHYDAVKDQFIVQYQEVPADIYGSYSGGPYTFEIILSPDGTIVYQYYDLDGDVTEATVGIENDYGNQGIQLAYKEPYLEDEFAVKFELVPTAFVYQTVELSPDEIATGVNLGNREIPTGHIQGTKWHDLNGNGIQDSGEVGLGGWTIYLDENENGQLDNGEISTVTDAQGNYSFTDLASGTYTVAEVLQTDWQSTYPSDFQYQWSDSNDPKGPSFNWIDISAVGTSIDFEYGHDYKEVALPFSFPFYGKAQNSLKISSEGYLTFGSDGTNHTNDEIPDSQQPNDLIAPFWDELDGKTGSIYYHYDQDTEQFIVQYQDILQDVYGNPDRANTFEVILSADGTILYQYDDINGDVYSVTVGIENGSGTEGINIVHNDPYLEDNLAIEIELVFETPLSHTVYLDSGETVSDINFGNQLLNQSSGLLVSVAGNSESNPLQTYSNASKNPQDKPEAVITYLDNGKEVKLENNAWKSWQPFDAGSYQITENTVLTFDYFSTEEGEIQGIGFDNNDDFFDDTQHLFQLFGTQVFDNVVQDFNTYQLRDGWQSYSINVGEYFTGIYDRLILVNDHDSADNLGSNSSFRNLVLSEKTSPSPPSELTLMVNGNPESNPLQTYADGSINNGKPAPQDKPEAVVTYRDNGNEVELENNAWKSWQPFDITNYNVTENTRLNFQFRSDEQAEIQGMGFDNDDDLFNDTNTIFQLYGTQTFGNQTYNDYQGLNDLDAVDGWKDYSISLGQHFTGEYDRIVFFNDNDTINNLGGSSQFRNIVLSEIA